jgi:hypothetical protein
MADVKNNPEQVFQKDNSEVVHPIGYSFVPSTVTSWDDLDEAPRPAVKLCRLEDPTCEACQ